MLRTRAAAAASFRSTDLDSMRIEDVLNSNICASGCFFGFSRYVSGIVYAPLALGQNDQLCLITLESPKVDFARFGFIFRAIALNACANKIEAMINPTVASAISDFFPVRNPIPNPKT